MIRSFRVSAPSLVSAFRESGRNPDELPVTEQWMCVPRTEVVAWGVDKMGRDMHIVSKKLIFKRSNLLVSQITAQGTKINLLEYIIAKLNIISFVVPNNKYFSCSSEIKTRHK